MTTILHTTQREEFERVAAKKSLALGDRQRQYLRQIHLQMAPCPSCNRHQSFYDAIVDDASYNENGLNPKFRCVECKRPLHHVVPFIATGVGWSWSIDFEEEASAPA